MMMYQTETKKWSKSHAKIMIIIKFICEVDIRVHLINIVNAYRVLVILKNLYEETDSSIIDISYKKINQSNLKNFFEIETYVQHLKKHRKKIIQTNENIENWQMSSVFRMNLSFRLNLYVFQLVHAAKNTEKVLIINEIMTALIVEKKRTDYEKNNEDAKTRSVKNEKKKNFFSNQSINEKKKKSESYSYCKNLFHNEKQCYYFHFELKKKNWKSHEIKFQLIKSWDKEKDFVAFKSKKDDKSEKMKKIKSMISDSDESDSFFNSLRSVRIIKHCSIESSVRRLIHKFKDFNFWLNSAADRHLCYDKTLMHDIKFFTTSKLAEVANERLIIVKNIEFITFSLNIRDKNMKNTLFNVEYASDLNYHMISTNILNRKDCSVTTKNDKLIVIDLKNDVIFMIEIIQSETKKNFYVLNFWHFSIRKVNAIIFIWKNWHKRLKHLNMQNVKKLVNISLINDNESDSIGKCEVCIMKKMHQKLNHQLVRASRRANRSSQRFHTNLADDEKIVLIFKNKRYAIIFVNDFSNYIWIYLMRKKNEFQRVLCDFIKMMLTRNLFVKTIKCNNVKKNINDFNIELFKNQSI